MRVRRVAQRSQGWDEKEEGCWYPLLGVELGVLSVQSGVCAALISLFIASHVWLTLCIVPFSSFLFGVVGPMRVD